MSGCILALNSGSSSVKFALHAAAHDERRLLHGAISELGPEPKFHAADSCGRAIPAQLPEHGPQRPLTHARALEWLVAWLAAVQPGEPLLGVGHRVVHGGERYGSPVRVDPGILDYLGGLTPMAPLHQPHDLGAIATLMRLRPDLPQVACFDTEFHRTMPAPARNFALPRALTAAGVHRYGFHGLSYEYVAQSLPRHLGALADGRVVVAHLGNGASMCAMQGRRSVATTMGMTALDGLMMGTRSGAIDPGAILYLMRERGLSVADIEDLLYHRSGLLGVSGIASDMRVLLESRDSRAREAVELFAYRAAGALGSLAVALGGLDALVFTGGIGEHASPVRAMICEQARCLGIELDPVANARHHGVISSASSRVTVCVIATDEQTVIARHTCRVLNLLPDREPAI
jgi:acetate kinase